MVISEYYNNKGAEALNKQQYATAIAYFHKAIDTWSRSAITWSNLGVAYKLLDEKKLAETAYLKALKLSPKNFSTMTNIYNLYSKSGEFEKAEKYLKRVARYSKKNPYKLARLAELDMDNGNYSTAEKTITRAIKIKPEEPDFHHTLAKAYYYLDKKDEAIKQIQIARDVAKAQEDKDRFQNKLDTIARLYINQH